MSRNTTSFCVVVLTIALSASVLAVALFGCRLMEQKKKEIGFNMAVTSHFLRQGYKPSGKGM